MKIEYTIAPHFDDYVFNWDYETYLLLGGYGSSKSHHTAFKLILKLLQEKRKALVVRNVYDTIHDSCFELLCEILNDMNLLGDRNSARDRKTKVIKIESPMQLRFPNGSKIIFKGLDKTEKIKSIHGVSIIWIEEASEIKLDKYNELQGRLRTPDIDMFFILTSNPVGRENWLYRRFFVRLNDKGHAHVIMDEKKFYEQKTLISNGIYYHHSVPEDNPWLPWKYIKRLNELKVYDYPLYTVARLGMFGATGLRVLPQFKVATNKEKFKQEVHKLGIANKFVGLDFGFETSFNAMIECAVDLEKSYLYIYDEVYRNKLTDSEFIMLPEVQNIKKKIESWNAAGYNKMIVADNEDPKAIQYYRQNGFIIRGCRNKFAGSRLSNTRKIKRFKKIIVSPKCVNTIRELKDLTYKRKPNGDLILDDFNIDPHTFSALWYGLDTVTVADIKERNFNSKKGG